MRRCPYCKSIFVCWNWIHAYGGDRRAYEKANPHIDPKDLKDWGHECWDCEGCSETHAKVRNGMPYWILRRFYRIFRRGMTKELHGEIQELKGSTSVLFHRPML